MGRITTNEGGFTLIELIVVIAILGVLAATTTPMISSFLSDSKVRGFDSELERIRASVDAFYSAPDNARFLGKRQFPVIGRAQTDSATLTQQTTPIGNIVDDRSPFDAVNSTTSTALWNPVGGTVGLATSTVWTNGGTGGIRTIGSNGTGSADVWATVSVVRGGVTYYTDPRYFLIDFEALLSKNILSEIPQAASPDNKPQGSTRTYSGSYAWYVDGNGRVQAFYTDLPSTTGHVAGVFP